MHTSPKLKLLFVFSSVAAITFLNPPRAVGQEQKETPSVTGMAIEQYQEVKRAARKERIEAVVEQDQTGTDPRAFANRWMPYYRYTESDNGMIQHDVTAFGSFGFSSRVGMFYELPLAQYRDFSDVPGLPPNAESDAIGLGDMDIKFLLKPAPLEFTYGAEGKMSGSVLLGTDFLLPTATDPLLAGDAFLFAPIAGFVLDMPMHGFLASLNLYYFDVYKKDSAPETSRYVGRYFYMQPLTPPGKWWGGFYIMPEFQPVYDFTANDFSLWIGPEIGKVLAPGKIVYVKPGWGIDNSEAFDRKFTFEAGFRWFF